MHILPPMSTLTATSQSIPSTLSETFQALAHELDLSIRRLDTLEPTGPDHGGEDEANFTLSWLALEQLQPDAGRRAFLDGCFRDLQRWVREDCHKGYQPIQEAHHGTEPFLLFLPRYAQLPDAPRDEIAELMCGAADYILNRVPGQPQWFDEEHCRFAGVDLGSKRAGIREEWQVETADHLRFIHIALAAFELSGDQAYADWACRYAGKRAQLINTWPDDEPLPWAWWHDGRGITGAIGAKPTDNLLAPQHHMNGDPLGGIENLLASGVMQAFAGAHALQASEDIARAAARIATTLIDHLSDPYFDPAATALRIYRHAFKDTAAYQSLDERITTIAADWPQQIAEQYLVMPGKARRSDPGVGRRADMQRWYEMRDDGLLQPTAQPCTAARALLFDASGDESQLALALSLAQQRMHVARRGLRCGREHADMGSSIAACGAGHGRCWGTGNVTGVLDALTAGSIT